MAHHRPSALLAFVVAASACLPDLDASLRDDACVGGAPDGFLQDGEQCDDGNEDTGDGCAPSCRVECSGVVDPLTFHCFEPLANELSPTLARDTCRTKSGAGLVTIRSDRERVLVVEAMRAGGLTRSHTAYELAPATTVELEAGLETFRFAVAAPSSLYRSPGLLLSASPRPLACSGCYPSDPMLTFTASKDRLVLDADDGLSVVGPSVVAGAVCERVPVGSPANLCPGVRCAAGAAVELEQGGARYALFTEPKSVADAEATCASAMSGHLLWLTSEEERERVVRWFAGSTSAVALWIGWSEVGGEFVWSDGVRSDDRPSFSTIAVPAAAGTCGVLMMATGSFEVGLVRPTACAGEQPPDKLPQNLPFLCKSLDLNRR